MAPPPVVEQAPQPLPVQGLNAPARLTEPQLAKLQSELDVVQGNMRVLAEMLTHLTSPNQTANQPDPADLALLTVRFRFFDESNEFNY